MGADPGTAEMIALLGSSLIGGITAPQGQKLQSFAGSSMDPEKSLANVRDMLNGYMAQTQDRAQAGTHLDTTVNPLPSFVGKALPMTIAAPGADERRIPRRTLAAPPTGGVITRDPNADPGTKIPLPAPHTGPQDLPTPGFNLDSQRGGASDQDQAAAAITLLKKAGLNI